MVSKVPLQNRVSVVRKRRAGSWTGVGWGGWGGVRGSAVKEGFRLPAHTAWREQRAEA